MGRVQRLLRLLSTLEDMLVLVFCLCLFSCGVYGVYDSLLVFRQADDSSLLKYRPGYRGAEAEKEIQGTMAAWLTLDGTGIDYPVMQGASNFEYLNKNPYGEYALSGSIFLDARNSADFSDPYSLIYGHHMEQGYMFGDLDLYRDPDFFRENRSGTLIVNGEEHRITLTAVLDVTATDEVIFFPDSTSIKELKQKIRETAVVREMTEGKHWIAFSTCRYPNTADRTVVVGVFD